jgi:hypothetical protein
MDKWKTIDTSDSELPEQEDESLNDEQADEDDNEDLDLSLEEEELEDENNSQTDDENEEPPKKEEKPSRAQERIRELVAKQKKAEEEANLWRSRYEEAETEKQTFKKQNRESEKSSVESELGRITASIDSYQRLQKQALEANDIDAILKTQTELTKLQVELMATNSMKKSLESDEPEEKTQKKVEKQSKAAPLPDVVRKWKSKNDWFDKDPILTGAALGVNKKLLDEGFDPTSQEFYDEIDSRMAPFLGKTKAKEQAAPKKKSSPVVGESSKSSPSTKVQVTDTDKKFAHKMGISPQEYLKQKANYELNNSRGVESYKPIFIKKGDK